MPNPENEEDQPVRWNMEVKKSLRDKILKIKSLEGRALYKIVELALEEYIKNHYPALAA